MPRWNPNNTTDERRNMRKEEQVFLAGRQTDKSMWCDICSSRDTTLRVDRDPMTQKLRGLLCTECAAGLARFKDNYSYLVLAARYMRRSESYRDILCQECPCPEKEPLQFYTVRQVLSNDQPMLVSCQCKCHKEETNGRKH